MASVSVIVPAYNAEATLEACVRSVLGQNHGDLEVILVDDGSTDGTAALCEALQAEDPRVVAVHQPNAGVSAARNAGLDRARGKYLMFADSDDRLKPGIMARAVTMAEAGGADLVIFGFDYHMLDTGEVKDNSIAESFCGSAREFFDRWFCFTVDRELFNPPWNKLILRRLAAEHRLRFDDRYSICEDMAFSADALRASQRPALLAGSGYEYHLRSSGSLVFRFYDNYFEALCHYHARALDYCGQFPPGGAQQRRVNSKLVNLSLMYIKRIYAESGWDARRRREKLVAICESGCFRGALAAADVDTRKKRLACLLARRRLYGLLDAACRAACGGPGHE